MSAEHRIFRHEEQSERRLLTERHDLPIQRVTTTELIDSDGKASQYEIGFNDEVGTVANGTRACMMQADSSVLIDTSYFERYWPRALTQLQKTASRPLFLARFGPMLQHELLQPYSCCTATLMDTLDWKGARLLDLGCADGLQSAIAARGGAELVYGVDNLGRWESDYVFNGLRNSPTPGFRAEFLEADITEPTLPLPELAAQRFTHIVANIGPHSIYRGAHISAINLLKHLPDVQVFVGGGYCNSAQFYSPYEAYEELAGFGFRPLLEMMEANEEHPRMAFIAVR